MSKNDFTKLLDNIQSAKRLVQEFQEFSPQLKKMFVSFLNVAKENTSYYNKNQQIYDAIKFASDKIKCDPNIILGCTSDDPFELKKEIYHLKSRYFHPDGFNPDQQKFVRIKEAFNKLNK